MNSIILIAVVVTSIAVAFGDIMGCHEHEKIMECFNPCTPRTCPNAIHPKRGNELVCPMVCEANICDCEEGFLRNACGICVPETNCAMPCECRDKEREEKRCARNCDTHTCEHIKPHHLGSELCQSNFCTDLCDCKPGFARDMFDQCVPIERCDRVNTVDPLTE